MLNSSILKLVVDNMLMLSEVMGARLYVHMQPQVLDIIGLAICHSKFNIYMHWNFGGYVSTRIT